MSYAHTTQMYVSSEAADVRANAAVLVRAANAELLRGADSMPAGGYAHRDTAVSIASRRIVSAAAAALAGDAAVSPACRSQHAVHRPPSSSEPPDTPSSPRKRSRARAAAAARTPPTEDGALRISGVGLPVSASRRRSSASPISPPGASVAVGGQGVGPNRRLILIGGSSSAAAGGVDTKASVVAGPASGTTTPSVVSSTRSKPPSVLLGVEMADDGAEARRELETAVRSAHEQAAAGAAGCATPGLRGGAPASVADAKPFGLADGGSENDDWGNDARASSPVMRRSTAASAAAAVATPRRVRRSSRSATTVSLPASEVAPRLACRLFEEDSCGSDADAPLAASARSSLSARQSEFRRVCLPPPTLRRYTLDLESGGIAHPAVRVSGPDVAAAAQGQRGYVIDPSTGRTGALGLRLSGPENAISISMNGMDLAIDEENDCAAAESASAAGGDDGAQVAAPGTSGARALSHQRVLAIHSPMTRQRAHQQQLLAAATAAGVVVSPTSTSAAPDVVVGASAARRAALERRWRGGGGTPGGDGDSESAREGSPYALSPTVSRRVFVSGRSSGTHALQSTQPSVAVPDIPREAHRTLTATRRQDEQAGGPLVLVEALNASRRRAVRFDDASSADTDGSDGFRVPSARVVDSPTVRVLHSPVSPRDAVAPPPLTSEARDDVRGAHATHVGRSALAPTTVASIDTSHVGANTALTSDGPSMDTLVALLPAHVRPVFDAFVALDTALELFRRRRSAGGQPPLPTLEALSESVSAAHLNGVRDFNTHRLREIVGVAPAAYDLSVRLVRDDNRPLRDGGLAALASSALVTGANVEDGRRRGVRLAGAAGAAATLDANGSWRVVIRAAATYGSTATGCDAMSRRRAAFLQDLHAAAAVAGRGALPLGPLPAAPDVADRALADAVQLIHAADVSLAAPTALNAGEGTGSSGVSSAIAVPTAPVSRAATAASRRAESLAAMRRAASAGISIGPLLAAARAETIAPRSGGRSAVAATLADNLVSPTVSEASARFPPHSEALPGLFESVLRFFTGGGFSRAVPLPRLIEVIGNAPPLGLRRGDLQPALESLVGTVDGWARLVRTATAGDALRVSDLSDEALRSARAAVAAVALRARLARTASAREQGTIGVRGRGVPR